MTRRTTGGRVNKVGNKQSDGSNESIEATGDRGGRAMTERYWIYENWRAADHKALIHRASCGRCNDGEGWHGGTDSSNGRWIGPFDGLEEARANLAGMPAEVMSGGRPHAVSCADELVHASACRVAGTVGIVDQARWDPG